MKTPPPAMPDRDAPAGRDSIPPAGRAPLRSPSEEQREVEEGEAKEGEAKDIREVDTTEYDESNAGEGPD